MKLLPVLALAVLTLLAAAPAGAQTEAFGDSASARAALARAAQENPNDVSALTGYAEFLERYGDPACREAYARLLEALRSTPDTARAGVIAKRLAGYRPSGRQGLDGASGGRGELARRSHPRARASVRPHGGHFSGSPARTRSFPRWRATW